MRPCPEVYGNDARTRAMSRRPAGRGCRRSGGRGRAPSQSVSSTLVARRSSIALYPSAASSSERVRSKTLPGSILRPQISLMSSGKEAAHRRGAAEQVHLREEEFVAGDRDVVADADEPDVAAGAGGAHRLRH